MTSVELLYQMETDILLNLIRLLKRGAVGSATWQAEKLAQLGTLRAMNIIAIEKSLPKAVEAAQKEIAARTLPAVNAIDSVAGNLARVLLVGADAKLKATLDGWYLKNAAELNRMGATMLNSALRVYTATVEQVTAEALSGAMTGRQAIAKTAGDWAKNGIKAFTDKAGRNWSTEAYAQNITRTTVNNARRESQFQRMDDYGFDLIEISSHADARPGCAPYQGKVYSRNGETKGYPTLAETSYGEPDGIFGINCRHSMSVYIPGTKKSAEQFGSTEAAYKESQEQRRLERDIRGAKRALSLAQETGDATPEQLARYKEIISEKQSNMRAFIDESGITRRRDREQIY